MEGKGVCNFVGGKKKKIKTWLQTQNTTQSSKCFDNFKKYAMHF
jgi:hypothetical protein